MYMLISNAFIDCVEFTAHCLNTGQTLAVGMLHVCTCKGMSCVHGSEIVPRFSCND